MFLSILSWVVPFILGGIVGKQLARKGITADKRFENHQGWFLGGISAIAFLVLLLLLLYKFNLFKLLPLIIPSIILLYIGEYLDDAIICLGFLFLGLLMLLELQGKNSVKRMSQLFIAIIAISFPLSILIHYSLPVIDLVGEPKIIDGVVVLQTTSYTCAPSSIATLARFLGKNPNILEKDVVAIAQTSRTGTSTLSEIRTMRQLGLGGEYRHNLTIDDLVKINKPGLLHVKIKSANGEISHTVALLSINRENRTLVIANPLSGIEVKKFDEMKGYWMEEAVFVSQ